MSAVAEFTLLPRALLPQLVQMSGDPGWRKFLQTNGKSATEFNWSGWVFNPLLAYLEREIGMNGKKFEFAGLSEELSRGGNGFYEIFGAKEKNEFLPKLEPRTFAPEALREFSNGFNKENVPDAGEAMLAGIRALHAALSQVDESSVLLVSVG
jgi:hypothetical protein